MKYVFCEEGNHLSSGISGHLMLCGGRVFKARLSQTFSGNRRRHGWFAGLLGIIVLVSVMLAANSAHAYGDYGYSHEGSVGYSNVDWMARVSDDTPLSRVSIPGTHDTGTYEFDAIGKNPELIGYVAGIVAILATPVGPILGPLAIAAAAISGISLSETVMNYKTQTQSLSFDTQLASGIRAWDIRLGAKDNVFLTGKDESCTVDKLIVFHGVFKQGPNFWDVLNSASRFLNDHPSEAIVMRIRRENGCTNNFAESVRDAFARYPGLLYSNPNNPNPTLGDLRGHVYVIQDFSATANSGTTLGPSWSGLDKQDDFEVTNLYTKWNAAKNFFIATNQSPNSLRFNYLSGTGPGLGQPYPSEVAGGYNGQEGVNMQAARFLRSGTVRYAGIVHADFPGAALIDAIIQLNSRSLVNETVAIAALVNGKRACARRLGNDDSQIVADGQSSFTAGAGVPTAGAAAALCEQFVVVDAGNNLVALRSLATGGYVGAFWDLIDHLFAYYPTYNPDLCALGFGCDPLSPSQRAYNNGIISDFNTFGLEYQGNGQYGLKAFGSSLYVAAENAGTSPLVANRGGIGLWETFVLEPQFVNATVAIKAAINAKYVGSAPNVQLFAYTGAVYGDTYRYVVEDAGDGWVALRSKAWNIYVTAENGGQSPLITNRSAIGEWEKFKIKYLGDGKFALLSKANGKYVTAENKGAAALIANRDAIGIWETFYIERQ